MVDNPSDAGPYTIRVNVPSGTKVMPHRHAEDRIYTVMSGVFYIGVGEQFDGDKVKAYPPGSVIGARVGNEEVVFSGDYVTQIMAVGPRPLKAA